MCDECDASELDDLVRAEVERGCYVSFVGIGASFNAELAEVLSKHRGCNYFCVTNPAELHKVIVEDFAWSFFPCAFDFEATCRSDDFDVVAVYGTPYETRQEVVRASWHPCVHKCYGEEFRQQARTLALCTRRAFGRDLPLPAVKAVLDCLLPVTNTIITVDSVFPSAVEADGSVEGGLILLRLRPRSPQARHRRALFGWC
eukprot:SRR837773.7989.p1 GENE.SRR837773.7989~~SRR837773.7989.p1  ORF type:complete len:210 (-),score=44.08 SRR837773.7989:51-653(-)